MKTKTITVVLILFALSIAQAPAKKLWAKSFLNQQAPELIVEKWLTEKPDMEDKYVLVDFWATWCGPCRRAIPELNRFHDRFKENLVVIGISDEPEEVVRKMKEPILRYYNAIDTQGRMKKALEVSGIPHVILIDPEGRVRWEGYPLLQGEELTEDVIMGILNTKPPAPATD